MLMTPKLKELQLQGSNPAVWRSSYDAGIRIICIFQQQPSIAMKVLFTGRLKPRNVALFYTVR